MYYDDKIQTLRGLFSAKAVKLDKGTFIVDDQRYPIIDDVIILLEPSRYPPDLARRLGHMCQENVSTDEFSPDIQYTFGDEWQEFPDILAEHEKELLDYATQEIKKIEEVTVIGNSSEKASVLSFVIDKIHPHDIGTIMDKHGVAIRTGHHCTQPIMDFYEISATARASFGIYNSKEDVDKMIYSIKKTIEVFA